MTNTSLWAENGYELKVNRYEVIGENPLSEQQTKLSLAPFLGPLKGLQQLQDAAAALQNALQAEGYGFYKVTLAPQTLETGIVKLKIKAIKVNNITVQHGFVREIYFSSENILASLPSLQEEYSPNIYRIARELELANKNPAKQATVQFTKSEKADYINANILVNAQAPDNFHAWLNNTGTRYTGDYRLGIGYKNNNLFDKDHELALSFTTSPDFPKDVQQYGISYRIPLFKLLAVWQLYAYYSDIDSGVVAGGFDVSGRGTFIGTKYEWHLPKLSITKSYNHQLVFGLDDKLFDNEVFFTGSPFGNDVRSTPISISYQGLWKELKRSFSFYVGLDKNLTIGSLNNNKTYALNRYKAKADWYHIRYGSSFEWLYGGWMVKGRFDGQHSEQALISGEQFGIGGLTGGVRGFIERELIGDRGLRGSLEIWLPSFWQNQMRLLTYLDAGYVRREHALPGELDSETIASAGVGFAWRIKEKVNLNVYLSQAINGNTSNTVEDPTLKGDNKIQFNLNVKY